MATNKLYFCEACKKRRETRSVSSLQLSHSPVLMCRQCRIHFEQWEKNFLARRDASELASVIEPPEPPITPLINPAREVKRGPSSS